MNTVPLEGEYGPSPAQWVREQVELYEGSGGTRRSGMVAREVTGDEKAQCWRRAVAAYPAYAEYQEQTDRVIPVFVLEPEPGT